MTSPKPLPLEALERLKAWTRVIGRAPLDGEPFVADEDVTLEMANDLRSLLTSYEAQGERLREVEEALASFAAERPGHWSSEDGGFGTNDFRRGYAECLSDVRVLAQAALTQPPAVEKTDD